MFLDLLLLNAYQISQAVYCNTRIFFTYHKDGVDNNQQDFADLFTATHDYGLSKKKMKTSK